MQIPKRNRPRRLSEEELRRRQPSEEMKALGYTSLLPRLCDIPSRRWAYERLVCVYPYPRNRKVTVSGIERPDLLCDGDCDAIWAHLLPILHAEYIVEVEERRKRRRHEQDR